MTMSCDDASISTAVPGGVRRFEVFTGAGTRRRWTAEAKARIVAESCMAGETVSGVARRHGLAPSQLFAWRRQLRRAREAGAETAVGFVPVIVDRPGGRAAPPAGAERAAIEVELAGARLRIGNDASPSLVGAVIAALQAEP